MRAITLDEAVKIINETFAEAKRRNAYPLTAVLLDAGGQLVASVSPNFVVVREGYEAEAERLKTLGMERRFMTTPEYADFIKVDAERYGAVVKELNIRIK